MGERLPVALYRRSLGRRPRRQPASAAALVAGLAEAVPGFADVGDWQGRPVPLHRKAAGLVTWRRALAARMRASHSLTRLICLPTLVRPALACV